MRLLCVFFNLLVFVYCQDYYYGRCFGTANSWRQQDNGSSHHLEVTLNPVQDLDNPGTTFTNFTANINIESTDGTGLYVAYLKGPDMQTVLPNIQGQQNGVSQIDPSQGVVYCSFLSDSAFQEVSESQLVSLYVSLLSNAQTVYIFGQVYSDSNGINGIHDIHEITGEGSSYGDGAFITQDASGNYYGVFARFDTQSLC
eukprot:TRINITY_DN191_c1_g2_i8.p1 TRINITY_DN191_c1_g2~~TRINITY_DN191_c1_g2_i8.p1  ORF type:complete len:199 (-),score=28.02 TRINITY_DN191_c1_g2_i8:146-742(-)